MRGVIATGVITATLLTSQATWATVFQDYEVIGTLPPNASPRSITSADFDTDFDFDLAVTNQIDNEIAITLNSGNENFGIATTHTTGAAPYSITNADLNNLGDSDLITANHDDNTISVFINSGNNKFANKVDYPTGTAPVYVIATKLTGNHIDLITTNSGSNDISVFINNGDGTFATKVDYPAGTSPNAIAAADFDLDNDVDLAVVNMGTDTVSILRNNGDGTFATKIDFTTGSGPFSVASNDLNGDNLPDLAISNSGNNTISVLLNDGSGGFTTKVDYDAGATPHFIAIDDLDNDSDFDIAVANHDSDTISVYTNNGGANFSTVSNYSALQGPSGLFIQDINRDNYADLLVTNLRSNNYSFLKNLTPVTPDDFGFAPQTDVPPASVITSETITIQGMDSNVLAPISIAAKAQFSPSTNSFLYNAAYRVNDGPFSSQPRTVKNDDKVQVRLTSSSEFETTVETTLTIGGGSGIFSVTTSGDTTPDNIVITPVVDVEPSTLIISEPLAITGIGDATTIGIAGGEYRINGGNFTTDPDNLSNNDVLEVRVISANSYSSSRSAILSIGGVQSSFVVITKDDPSASSGGNSGLSLWMIILLTGWLLLQRRGKLAERNN